MHHNKLDVRKLRIKQKYTILKINVLKSGKIWKVQNQIPFSQAMFNVIWKFSLANTYMET